MCLRRRAARCRRHAREARNRAVALSLRDLAWFLEREALCEEARRDAHAATRVRPVKASRELRDAGTGP
jgi:hypothetical protein